MTESTFSAVMRESTRLKLNQIEERNTRLHEEHTRVLAELEDHADPQSKLNCLYNYLSTSTDRTVQTEQNHILSWMQRTLNDGFVDPSEAQFYVDRTLDLMASGRRRFEYAYLYSCLLWEWNDNRASCLQGRNNHHLPQAVLQYLNRHAEESIIRHRQVLLGPPPVIDSAKVDSLVDSLTPFFSYQHNSSLNLYIDSTTIASAIRAIIRSDLVDKEDIDSLEKMLSQNEALKDLASSYTVMLSSAQDWRWDQPLTELIKEDAGGKRRFFFRPQFFHLIFLTTISLLLSREFVCYYNQATSAAFTALPEGKPGSRRQRLLTASSIAGNQFYGSLTSLRNQQADSARLLMLQESDSSSGGRIDGYGSRAAAGSTSISSAVNTILGDIATDIRMYSTFRPTKASYVAHVDFQSFGSSLSHDLILQLLSRLSFDANFIALVRNYLRAPVRTENGDVVTLQRGVLNGIHMSRFLGELLLSFLDIYVASESGLRLRRLFDDIWIWDRSRSKIDRAIRAIKDFAAIFGLEINPHKTGYVICPGVECKDPRLLADLDLPKNPIGFGFLEIHPNGDIFPSLDKVELFAGFMKEDLRSAAELSVIEWAKRFNKNIAFFESSCGVYCNAFGGQQFLSQRKLALDKLFSLVLDSQGSSPATSGEFRFVQFVDSLIKSRPFGQRFHGSISVPWLFMPISAGGLGITNPYLNWVAHSMTIEYGSTFSHLTQTELLIHLERQQYDILRNAHDSLQLAQPKRKNKNGPQPFRTFEEFQANRFFENRNYIINFVNEMKVIAEPALPDMKTACFAGEVDFSANLRDFTNRGAAMYEGKFGTLNPYYQHLVYRYLPILRREFGSIAFLDTSLIPYGLISSLSSGSIDS